MLIEFSVANYRSFDEMVTLSMVAADIESEDRELDLHNVIEAGDLRLLRTAAIYGANASGKSNLCKAISFMRHFVLNSSKETQVDDPVPVEPFRLREGRDQSPSFFQIVFISKDGQFRYGFEADRSRVVSEWLYELFGDAETELFLRKTTEDIIVDSDFLEGMGLAKHTRSNALFLSVVAQFNGPIASHILRSFRNLDIVEGLDDQHLLPSTVRALSDDKTRERVIELVRNLDLSIADIQLEDTETVSTDEPFWPQMSLPGFTPLPARYSRPKARGNRSISVIHSKYGEGGLPASAEVFDLRLHESEGTQKLVGLAGPLLNTLDRGQVVIMDEFDTRLHPVITTALVRLFQSEVSNKTNPQLIFTTHDTNLLSSKLFRRDQVWFMEKDRKGASHLYSLAEFKMRGDISFERNYLAGRYGAIPFLGDLIQPMEEIDAQTE